VRLLNAVTDGASYLMSFTPAYSDLMADLPGVDGFRSAASGAGVVVSSTRTILFEIQNSLSFDVKETREETPPPRPAPAVSPSALKPATVTPRPEPENPAAQFAVRQSPAPSAASPSSASGIVARGAPEPIAPVTSQAQIVAPVVSTPVPRSVHGAVDIPAQQPAEAVVSTGSHRGTLPAGTAEIDRTGPRAVAAGATERAGPAVEARSGGVAATDGVLLRRFATNQDQAAFSELVQRHGRSVLAISTRVLGDADRALDASQVTFAALARRAAALEDRGSLAGWLHQVARRMALRLRASATRQRRLEQVAAELYQEADDTLMAVEQEDVFRALREELERLPEKFRLPLTLCYLDGLTHAEVGRAVSLPRGSVAKRIGEGLSRLRDRLAERGILL
jgi:RNA polymerase sigma factor (sigma-70 family)